MDPKDPRRISRTFESPGLFNPDDQKSTRLSSGKGLPNSLAKPYISDDKLKPGDIVGDNYVIIELLGVGGMGYVYKVRHLILEKIYAMKTISSEQVSEMAWRRLQVEAQAIARINHPNIVGIHNLGIHQGTQQGSQPGSEQVKIPFYVMDYLKGKNLAEILKRKKRLTLEESLPIFIETCNGLGYAHKKGIVHRDIKPGNIVILDEMDISGARVKLVDFGIAKLAGTIDPDNQKLTTIGEVFGSPLYMSPEQCEGNRIDARSDIYSLGCTFFETLTGEVPFHGENQVATMLMHSQAEPRTLAEVSGLDFPESIEHLVATMLEKAPMNRYPNLERIGDDLEKIQRGEEISTSPYINNISLDRFGEANSESVIDEDEEIQIVKPTQRKLQTFALAGAFLVLGAIAVFAYSLVLKSSRTTPVDAATVPGTAAAVEKAIARSSNLATSITQEEPHPNFYSTTFNGDKSIVFNFPADQSLGKIGNLHLKMRKEAKGQTILKVNGKICLLANDYLCAHPSLIDLFRPDDLWSFSIPLTYGQAIDTRAIMPHVARLTGLGDLNLKANKADNSIIPYLEKLQKLQSLNVSTTDITGDALAKYSGLRNLQFLDFGYNKGVPALLLGLKSSNKLQTLNIPGPDFMLTIEHAKLIAQCKNLRILDVEASGLTDESFMLLSELPKLIEINVRDCAVTAETIKKVKAARKGKPIKILTNSIRNPNAFGGESPEVWIK
ncbi:MAG: protein kinase [Candidatus Melainabacteria bacterium]|nr:protein kinase [Candidatus Melainabacteria bacterium]